VLDGDELRTDVPALLAKLVELGAKNVLCILSTTSCFAPRGFEKLLDVGRLAKEHGVPHVANNAYGVQCAGCMKAIASASRHGRLDAFVQSTDKNFLVPVGGAIVASADATHGAPLMAQLRKTYPGRASISPILDLFITLLHLGASGWSDLLKSRRELWPVFQERLRALAAKHGERLLCTPNNNISMAVSLTPPPGSKAPTTIGASLFVRLVSGVRVVTPTDKPKAVCGLSFCSFGSHHERYPTSYFAVACALGITAGDMELFLKRVDKALGEWKQQLQLPPPQQPPQQPPPQQQPSGAECSAQSAKGGAAALQQS